MGHGCSFQVAASLVLTLLPGPIVLAVCVSLLHFSVLCIGLLMLWTWDIWSFFFKEVLILFEHCGGHRLLSERSLGLIFGLTVLF